MSNFDHVGKDNLENWYSSSDPWEYETTPDDKNRREHIRIAIPKLKYKNALDIGCGNGYITSILPGENVFGVDISENAIAAANERNPSASTKYLAASIFDLPKMEVPKMDLILVTGVLYDFYLGNTLKLALIIIDSILKPGGIVISSHIHEWYKLRFPYLTISREWFPYRDYYQILEVYEK